MVNRYANDQDHPGLFLAPQEQALPEKYIDIWMKYSYVLKPIQPKIGIHVKGVYVGNWKIVTCGYDTTSYIMFFWYSLLVLYA